MRFAVHCALCALLYDPTRSSLSCVLSSLARLRCEGHGEAHCEETQREHSDTQRRVTAHDTDGAGRPQRSPRQSRGASRKS